MSSYCKNIWINLLQHQFWLHWQDFSQSSWIWLQEYLPIWPQDKCWASTLMLGVKAWLVMRVGGRGFGQGPVQPSQVLPYHTIYLQYVLGFMQGGIVRFIAQTGVFPELNVIDFLNVFCRNRCNCQTKRSRNLLHYTRQHCCCVALTHKQWGVSLKERGRGRKKDFRVYLSLTGHRKT